METENITWSYKHEQLYMDLGRYIIGDAIMSNLLPKYVYIPQGDGLHEIVEGIMEGFECHWGFPHAVGAIDESHILILKPVESAPNYFNGKCHCSVLMLL